MTYKKTITENGIVWTEAGRDWKKPKPTDGIFAWDTEEKTLFDGEVISDKELKKKVSLMKQNELRQHLSCRVWLWQVYDNENGFFGASSFLDWLQYLGLIGGKCGYNYNSTFDHSQLDWQILTRGWKKHIPIEDYKKLFPDDKSKGRKQPMTYASLHSGEGARYQYDLWYDYKNSQRKMVQRHVKFRDFCKLVPGGLRKCLESFKPIGRDGKPLLKLEMEYQEVDEENPTEQDLDYCRIDVEGLLGCVYMLNRYIEEYTDGEQRLIYTEKGKPNVVTGGGLAKRAMLQAIYPDCQERWRLSRFQDRHPMSIKTDRMWRDLMLLRGGITIVNPFYRGKWGHNHLWIYDVNSLYPFIAAAAADLSGGMYKTSIKAWKKMKTREKYEAVYIIVNASGKLRPGMVPVWYDEHKKEYVSKIKDEDEPRAFFECEILELEKWYDFTYDVREVVYWKKREGLYTSHFKKWYDLKAKAKAENNMALSAMAKLVLNGGIGKFGERLTRSTVDYILNEDNVVRGERGGNETDEDGRMSVVMGSYITALARTYMLSSIRESYGEETEKYFVYMDTDSIHTLKEMDPEKVDKFRLGAFKCEGETDLWCYLAPKTYMEMIGKEWSIHSKGVNVGAVEKSLEAVEKAVAKLMKEQGSPEKTDEETLKSKQAKFNYDTQFETLCAMNVKGGKVLVPVRKYLARKELAPDWWEQGEDRNYFGEI